MQEKGMLGIDDKYFFKMWWSREVTFKMSAKSKWTQVGRHKASGSCVVDDAQTGKGACEQSEDNDDPVLSVTWGWRGDSGMTVCSRQGGREPRWSDSSARTDQVIICMEVTCEAVSVSAITKSEDGAAAVEGVPRRVRAPPVPSRLCFNFCLKMPSGWRSFCKCREKKSVARRSIWVINLREFRKLG